MKRKDIKPPSKPAKVAKTEPSGTADDPRQAEEEDPEEEIGNFEADQCTEGTESETEEVPKIDDYVVTHSLILQAMNNMLCKVLDKHPDGRFKLQSPLAFNPVPFWVKP